MARSIIHLNVADFAVAVERLVDSRLKDRPVIIAPEGAARAVVYDMSEEAYRAGIRKGMRLRKAVRLCADASILPPHPDRYEQAMQALFKRALPYSPLIEPGAGDGHLFVDVTGTRRLFGPAVDVACRLRKTVCTDLSLNPIWSVAPNKLVAKVATRLVKPTGEYIVGAGDEEAFLAPLPVRLVPGIEWDDLIKLQEFNLTRVSQVTALSLAHLEIPFGKRAPFIYEAVRGVDMSPVLPAGESPPEVIVDHTFDNDTNDVSTLERALYGVIEEAGSALRHRRLAARRIRIILDYSDGIRHMGHAALKPATANDIVLFKRSRNALIRAWTRRIRIRHMRLIFGRLVFPPAQLALFPAGREKMERRTNLVAAMDKIRNRFGHGAVRMGRMLAV